MRTLRVSRVVSEVASFLRSRDKVQVSAVYTQLGSIMQEQCELVAPAVRACSGNIGLPSVTPCRLLAMCATLFTRCTGQHGVGESDRGSLFGVAEIERSFEGGTMRFRRNRNIYRLPDPQLEAKPVWPVKYS